MEIADPSGFALPDVAVPVYIVVGVLKGGRHVPSNPVPGSRQ